ncbi:MAG: GNAT family N-acetyltransferase [Oscillatoriaceae bacterium SKW80]|nr:GNAT family N-acetyltransferase [Oscillatoriaceae bacterium SKYG93]MCX8120338.1 GNAT family N-acetyltransferase [Oscillatoriaceae bacterium SKW80]MDW8453264.1 GNAT family N-acetyltransferase [Oscillatoriaceae cyanobacterium SKYGB_i_bin93]HIK27293.1 GNAT family N-acetyltransferase [Oscillatoriaceae cyanobacterium M7585_C2015_266]
MNNLVIKIADSSQEIADIKIIRKTVFQLEQNIPSNLDFDGLDDTSLQIIAYLDKQPVATARIRNIDEKTVKIERLAVLPHVRRQGIGKKMTEKALEIAAAQNIHEVLIHAQEYIKSLYEKLGFIETGEKFIEAGIPHIKMKRHIKHK